MPKEIQTVNNYNTYLYKVMKQVHPDSSITKESLNEINMIVHKVAEHIISSAANLAISSHKKTIMLVDIMSALDMVLLTYDTQLLKHAKTSVNTAIEKYRGSSKVADSSARTSRSNKAGLALSVSRSENLIRHHSRMRVSADASVALASVLEYLAAEIFDLSGNVCRDAKRDRITNRCVALAISSDSELTTVLNNIRLSGGAYGFSNIIGGKGKIYGAK